MPRIFLLFLCAPLVLGACAESAPRDFMGNTNWLEACESDDQCRNPRDPRGDAICACGVCTLGCTTSPDCAAIPGTSCEPTDACEAPHAAAANACWPLPLPSDAGHDATTGEPDGGDAGPTAPVCGDLAGPLPLLVVHEIGPEPMFGPRTEMLVGEVMDEGSGLPAELEGQLFGFSSIARWFRLEDADRAFYVLQQRLPVSFGVGPGDTIQLEYSNAGGGFSPARTRLHLERGGEVVFYYELGTALGDFRPPPKLQLERGQLLCHREEVCGTESDYEARITWDGSAKAVLSPGEGVTVGDYETEYLAGREDMSASPGCPDWYATRVELVMAPKEPAP